MNKLIRFIQNYLIVGFLFSALFLGLDISTNLFRQPQPAVKWLQTILSFNLMIWFSTLIVFLIMLVAIPLVREKTLKRIANLKERDEREQYITGKASRATYISTLSLALFLLFISIFSLHVHHFPQPQGKNKYHWSIGIGAGFSFFDKPKENEVKNDDYTKSEVFNSESLTPSKSAMILILLIWQLITFNITARKEQ